MKRFNKNPRINYKNIVEDMGFNYHDEYWNEKAFYQFTLEEVENIEQATYELNKICLEVVQYVIDNNLFEQLDIPQEAIQSIINSWNLDNYSVYGRFDLAYDGQNIKMLEYNADTPTSLFEASVVQWQWLQDCFPKQDQFNSIHEKLIQTWKELEYGKLIHFAYMADSVEDCTTALYMSDCAHQASYIVNSLLIEELGSDGEQIFDMNEEEIRYLFKLYPWECMWQDKFNDIIFKSKTIFIEPPWKMILSNKGILPLLWKMFPNHPNLLPAFYNDNKPISLEGKFVKKPFFSREGANISIVNIKDSIETIEQETEGDYIDNKFIVQEYIQPQSFEDHNEVVTPILGSWMIGEYAAGIGIREDNGITGNMSKFVPHLIKD